MICSAGSGLNRGAGPVLLFVPVRIFSVDEHFGPRIMIFHRANITVSLFNPQI